MTTVERHTPSPAPQAPKARPEAPRAEAPAPAMKPDTFQRLRETRIENAALDRTADVAGAHGVLADSVNAIKAAPTLMVGSQAVETAAKVAAGDADAIRGVSSRATDGVRRLAERVNPRHAEKAVKAASPVIKALGGVAKVLGKAAPVLGVFSSVYDTHKAATEKDPAKKGAAWTNAGLTVAGTAMGIGGLALGLTPIGAGLLAGAGALGAFQLVDAFLLKGKATEAIAHGAQKAWKALTSL